MTESLKKSMENSTSKRILSTFQQLVAIDLKITYQVLYIHHIVFKNKERSIK